MHMNDRLVRENRLTVKKDGFRCYDILYSTRPGDLAEELRSLGLSSARAVLVTDSNVAPLYAETFREVLRDASDSHELPPVYVLPAGEEHKNLDEIAALYRFLIENHCDRSSFLVALGGGVVGDMTGFAAATYLRGIDFIQIPTTLLAQADSSIGGKTGVDCSGYKNMVGAFKMPRLVFADVALLKTLDGRQFSSGFAEVMKHGLIKDQAYYLWLVDHLYEILERDEETLSQMLYRSNEIKRDVVERDPYEKGERMLLNFGHTIGHAIEKYLDFQMTHGECVALGCVAAAYLSWQRGLIPMEEYYEIRDMFVPFGLPITVTDIDPEEIVELTKSDKKMRGGQIRFVLLNGIGDAFTDCTVRPEEILAAVKEIMWVEEENA